MEGSNNSSREERFSRDQEPLIGVDVVVAARPEIDMEDYTLEGAMSTSERVRDGAGVRLSCGRAPSLSARVQTGSFNPVDEDPSDIPLDQSLPQEDIIFQDTDGDDETEQDTEDPDDDDDPGFVPRSDVGSPVMTDKTQWMINSLKIIHSDIQQIKVEVNKLPEVKNRVDEVQQVLGHVMTGFNEMKNAMSSMEMTIAKNRVDIAKLTDLVKTLVSVKTVQPTPQPQPIKQPIGESESNLDKLVLGVSKSKKLSSDQEVVLRNMLLSHDKDVILTSLKSIGLARPILSVEIDKLVQLDMGKSVSLRAALQVLTDILSVETRDVGMCEGPCSTPSYPATPVSRKLTPCPFST